MEKKGNIIIIIVLSILVILLGGYIIYDKVLSKNDVDNSVENNQIENNQIENNNSNNLEVVSEIPSDIYGTYYNNVKYGGEYTGEYFTLNPDGTAIVVHSTCSEGLSEPKTINYKFNIENDVLILNFDINSDSTFLANYTVYKGIYGYQFKHNNLSCTDKIDSYYVSKLD